MCLSSSNPASSPLTGAHAGSGATGNGSGSGSVAAGNGSGNESGATGNGSGTGSGSGAADNGSGSGAGGSGGNGVDAFGGNGAGNGGQQGTSTAHAITIGGETGDGPVADDEDDLPPFEKRRKRCTSDVWEHFTKKRLVTEDNGKTYVQLWAHCKWPRCKHEGRCESNYRTTGFWTHLRVAHSVVKGQMQLKEEKDAETGITVVVPYRYDEEASLKKFYLAIVMHEYPFNISEHEYFVDFIKSLSPTFPIRSRNTVRKEIMNMFLVEKEKLYDYFKSVSCLFSATVDMWTSN
jgi:hypothetical protein